MAAPRAHTDGASEPFGPWNPGITSQWTPELWRMCTIFRPENVFTTYDQAVEFRDVVDAYVGMQSFFLARALHPGSRNQHYEFVDNDVPMGEVPLTVAFGSHGEF